MAANRHKNENKIHLVLLLKADHVPVSSFTLKNFAQKWYYLPLGIADSFPNVSFKALKRSVFFSSASFNLFCIPFRLSPFSTKKKVHESKVYFLIY